MYRKPCTPGTIYIVAVRKFNKLEPSILQTLQEQLRSRAILRLHIPVPNPVHPLAQLLRQLLRISLDTRRAHGEKQSRLPTRLDHTLSPRAANLVVCVEHVRDLLCVGGGGWIGEKVCDGESIFECLTCTLSLPRRGCVCGIT